MTDYGPIFRLFDSTKEVDLLDPDSGWSLADPYWQPQITDLKGGGTFVSPPMVPGSSLLHGVEDNVTETIPLSATGFNPADATRTIRDLLKLLEQAENYHKAPWEYDPVWLEVKPNFQNARTGYSLVVRGRLPNLSNIFGQPFFSQYNRSVMEDLSLIIIREPFWRGLAPGSILGPLYNLIKNPDFELWTQGGFEDSEPDNWTNVETLWITGENSRHTSNPKWGNSALKVRVRGSTLTGAAKGVSQVIASGVEANTTYTVVAWVRSEGVSNGVGRLLVTYSDQKEIYRSATQHGWTLYAETITTGASDTIGLTCEILTTAANTDGTVYFDGLMLVKGSYKTEALAGLLPQMSGSHIVNHSDSPATDSVDVGDINWVDMWNIPGDVEALVRLEFQNNTTPSDLTDPVEVFERVRIGQRRTKDVLKLDNLHAPPGVVDTTASGDQRLTSIALDTTWIDVTSKLLSDNVAHNVGRYRVFVRVKDPRSSGDATLECRLRYFIGVPGIAEKTLTGEPALVRNDWTIVDVAQQAAMIWEQRKGSETPAQLGYTLQFRRSSSSETGYLDYVLAIPADGGFINCKIEPALTYGNTLIVDNTMAINVAATLRQGGWRSVFRTSQIPQSLAVYKDKLYIGCDAGEFYRFFNNTGTLINDFGANTVGAMAVYDGKLHLAHGAAVHSYDGVTISSALFTAPANVQAMVAFNGKLYLGLADGEIYEYDGSTASLSFNTAQTTVEALAVFGSRLYAGTTTNARVYQYDPVADSWAQSANLTTETGVYSLAGFGGKLYAGTGANGKVYEYDGSTWTSVVTFSTITTVQAMAVLNGVLYAGGTPSDSIQATANGTTWADAYDPAGYVVNAMIVYDGALFIAENTVKDLVVITFSNVAYKVPNYEGSTFTAPHTDRHRWVFLYDRKKRINNISDAALVGIGVVPRYKALRGDG